jgi:hypothetical protein
LFLYGNRLTRLPAAIRGLRAAGCSVWLDPCWTRWMTVDE